MHASHHALVRIHYVPKISNTSHEAVATFRIYVCTDFQCKRKHTPMERKGLQAKCGVTADSYSVASKRRSQLFQLIGSDLTRPEDPSNKS